MSVNRFVRLRRAVVVALLSFAPAVNAQPPVDAEPEAHLDDAATQSLPVEPAPAPLPVEPVPAPLPPLAPLVARAPDVEANEAGPRVRIRCGLSAYLEPSVFVSIGSYSPLPEFLPRSSNAGAIATRLAFGALIRRCAAGRERMHVRLGGTAFVTNIETSGHAMFGGKENGGTGAEAAIDWPVAPQLRLGARLGAESVQGVWLLEAGARLRYRESVWIGVDVYRVARSYAGTSCDEVAVPGCTTSVTGAMVGGGFEGRVGATVAIAGGIVGFVALIVALGSIDG